MHHAMIVAIRHANDEEHAASLIDQALAPFDENLDTPEHTTWVDDSEVGHAVKWFREDPSRCTGGGSPAKPFEEYVTEGNLEAWHSWTAQAVGGYCSSDADNGVYDAESDRYGYVTTWNEQGKWDWYQIGGRWSGTFLVKGEVLAKSKREAYIGSGGVMGRDPEQNYEGRADLIRKGDIDFETMKFLARQSADVEYDKVVAVTKGLTPPDKTLTELMIERHAEQGRDYLAEQADFYAASRFRPDLTQEERTALWKLPEEAARAEYDESPWIKAVKVHAGFYFGGPDLLEVYNVDRETFVERAARHSVAAAATLYGGEWREPQEAMMFRTTLAEQEAWIDHLWSLIDSLPDTAWLARVDYHS